MEDGSCKQRKELFLKMLRELDAEDIFQPISQVPVFNVKDNYQTIIQTIKENNNLYYPVYEDGIDNVIGVLCIKDLIALSAKDFVLKNLISTPFFISENIKIDELYLQLEQKDIDFAIVVDEHGSVRGIVTHTEIREALCTDESVDDIDFVTRHSASEFTVDAKIPLDDFNQLLKKDLICEDCDTIGGFVIEHFTYVPQISETFTKDNIKFTIRRTEGAKLLELDVQLL